MVGNKLSIQEEKHVNDLLDYLAKEKVNIHESYYYLYFLDKYIGEYKQKIDAINSNKDIKLEDKADLKEIAYKEVMKVTEEHVELRKRKQNGEPTDVYDAMEHIALKKIYSKEI